MIEEYPNSVLFRYHKIAVEFIAKIIYTGIIFMTYASEWEKPEIRGRA